MSWPKNTVSQGVCLGPCTWLVYALETWGPQIQLSLLFLKACEVPPKKPENRVPLMCCVISPALSHRECCSPFAAFI